VFSAPRVPIAVDGLATSTRRRHQTVMTALATVTKR
jgi:hypothetical protein